MFTAIESQFFVDCYIGGIVCTLLMDGFSLKKLLTVVLSSIKTNIRLVEVSFSILIYILYFIIRLTLNKIFYF